MGLPSRVARTRSRSSLSLSVRASACECAAIQDVMQVRRALDEAENRSGKELLDRIAAMLTKLGRRGYRKEDRER